MRNGPTFYADNLFANIFTGTLRGLGGDDRLTGSSANDNLFGDWGDDTLKGHDGGAFSSVFC